MAIVLDSDTHLKPNHGIFQQLDHGSGPECFCTGRPHTREARFKNECPSGCLSVKSGTATSGWYSTLDAALDSLSGTASACIFLYSGTYSEQVKIDYGGPLTSKPIDWMLFFFFVDH